eukprot:1183485-Prorocentrum_minimum.AAC.2
MEALEAERKLLAEIEQTWAEIRGLLTVPIRPLQPSNAHSESSSSSIKQQDPSKLSSQYGPSLHPQAQLNSQPQPTSQPVQSNPTQACYDIAANSSPLHPHPHAETVCRTGDYSTRGQQSNPGEQHVNTPGKQQNEWQGAPVSTLSALPSVYTANNITVPNADFIQNRGPPAHNLQNSPTPFGNIPTSPHAAQKTANGLHVNSGNPKSSPLNHHEYSFISPSSGIVHASQTPNGLHVSPSSQPSVSNLQDSRAPRSSHPSLPAPTTANLSQPDIASYTGPQTQMPRSQSWNDGFSNPLATSQSLTTSPLGKLPTHTSNGLLVHPQSQPSTPHRRQETAVPSKPLSEKNSSWTTCLSVATQPAAPLPGSSPSPSIQAARLPFQASMQTTNLPPSPARAETKVRALATFTSASWLPPV